MESLYEAHDVEEVAKGLINSVPEHYDLKGVKIAYLFTDKKQKDGGIGKITWAYVRPTNKELRAHDDTIPWFVMVVNEYVWQELDEKQKKALVDHELCHCKIRVNKEGFRSPVTKQHDYSDFSGVLARHGAWSPTLRNWGEHIKAKQIDMFEEVESKEGEES